MRATALLLLTIALPATAERIEIECPEGTEYVRIPDEHGGTEKCVTPEGVTIGPYISRFSDGSLSFYSSFRMPRDDEEWLPPVPVGPKLTWWENGALKDVGVYRSAQQHGPWIHRRRDGSIKRIEIFRNGWLVDLYGASGPITVDCPPRTQPRHSETRQPLAGPQDAGSPNPSRSWMAFEKWCAKTLPDGTESRHGPAVGIGPAGGIVSLWENRSVYSVSQGKWVRMGWREGEPKRWCQTLDGTGLPCPDDIEAD